jgi:hypothetical protein
VIIGPEGSGMRQSALRIISHYEITLEKLDARDNYFLDLGKDSALDAAIVTTGFLNPDLNRLMSCHEFALVPVLDGEALAIHNHFFKPRVIPRGLYGEGPAVPPDPVPTVASMSFLVGPADMSRLLISEALGALYEGDLQREIPTLIKAREAQSSTLLRLHPEARSFHDPYGGIGLLANFMESIAAIKELLFALGAGLYLLWARWRRLREEELKAVVKVQKEHLDALLDQTVKIERAQMDTQDPVKLKHYLDEVTRIKLKALEELTSEELRGDQMFAIFLTQCANLIRKIQGKIHPATLAGIPSGQRATASSAGADGADKPTPEGEHGEHVPESPAG